jgi:outer membrane murein-binding lipoprotein Lpp
MPQHARVRLEAKLDRLSSALQTMNSAQARRQPASVAQTNFEPALLGMA